MRIFLFLPLLLLFLGVSPLFALEKVEVPLGDSPSRGAANAPVVMVEFIDFQ